ncbi:MAG: hypothetical protein KGZ68_17275 [Dechloromonas sp.]|jgi:hypothetical protein|nr:hypothetical protein [Dechloromonas sp.]
MKNLLIVVLCALLLLVPTIGHSRPIRDIHPPLLVSQRGRVIVVIEHQQGAGNIAPLVAKMEHDIQALEVFFQQLLDSGKLDEGYPLLVIKATFHGELSDRFEHAATRLSRSDVALEGWGTSLDEIVRLRGVGRTVRSVLPLDRAYMIETATGLLTLNDLLAFIYQLPVLGPEQAAIEIKNETELEAATRLVPPEMVNATSFGIGPPEVSSFAYVGGDYFRATWRGGSVAYYVRTDRHQELAALPMLPYYLERPVWGEGFNRFLSFTTTDTLTILDRHRDKSFRINLADLPGLADISVGNLVLAVDLPQDTVDFSFREADISGRAVSFAFNMSTAQVSPIAGDFFTYLQAKGITEPTWASHDNRDPRWGQILVPFLMERGILSPREAEELIFLPTFVGVPRVSAEQALDKRLLAYSSRSTLMIIDLVAAKTSSVDMRALRPHDYQAIENIDMYVNNFGDEICFVVSGYGIEPTAYIWRIGVGLLGPTAAVPTEYNPGGWRAMRPGTPNSTFRDIRLLVGQAAAALPRQARLLGVVGALYLFLRWSLFLVLSFGLPYVLAHWIIIRSAYASARKGEKLGNAAELSGVLFVLLAVLTVAVLGHIFPYAMVGGDLPLPWGDPASTRRDLITLITMLIFVPAGLVLAFLNGGQASVLLRKSPSLPWGLGSYATLLGCALMIAYLTARQLGYFLDVDTAWLIFSLIVLIPYTVARQISHRLIRWNYLTRKIKA